MPEKTSAQPNQKTGLSVVSLIIGIVSGGAVGYDYATSLNVSPELGGLIGSAIGWAASKFLDHLHKDPGKEIRGTCAAIGSLGGAGLGLYVGVTSIGGAAGFLGGPVLGAMVGALAGQFVASLISMSALLLLLFGRGPVAMYLKSLIKASESPSGPREVAPEFNNGLTVGDCWHSLGLDECLEAACSHYESISSLTLI